MVKWYILYDEFFTTIKKDQKGKNLEPHLTQKVFSKQFLV